VFDIYYLITEVGVDGEALQGVIESLIFSDKTMRESTMEDVRLRLGVVLNDKRFASNLNNAKNNWLELPADRVVRSILSYFEAKK